VKITITRDTATPLLERIMEALGLAASLTLRVGATADYAAFVEFGHRVRSGWKEKGGFVGVVAPQPFIRPALDGCFDQIIEAYRDGVLDGDILSGLDEAGSNIEMIARSICPTETGYLLSTIFHEVE
jgi:hypothetical protein